MKDNKKEEVKKSRTVSLTFEQIIKMMDNMELYNEFQKLIEEMPVLTSSQAFKEAERRCK